MATGKQSSNFRQNMLVTQVTSAAAVTISKGDQYKVFTSTLVGTVTYTLPQATVGAGPFFFNMNLATEIIAIKPANATDLIAGNGAGATVTMAGANSWLGIYCTFAGVWSIIEGGGFFGTSSTFVAPVVINSTTGQVSLTVNGSASNAVNINAGVNAVGLNVQGTTNTSNSSLVNIVSGTAVGFSSGLYIQAGTNASDFAVKILNAAASATLLLIRGDGSGFIGPPGANGMIWGATGAFAFGPPSSALDAVKINAIANANTLNCVAPNTVSQSFGAVISAGTNATDYSLFVRPASLTSFYFEVRGDGAIGFHGAGPVLQSTGYGTPTGNVKTANFPGATATLLVTSEMVAQLILDLKAIGILGA